MENLFVTIKEESYGILSKILVVKGFGFDQDKDHINDGFVMRFPFRSNNEEELLNVYKEISKQLKECNSHVIFNVSVRYYKNEEMEPLVEEDSHAEKVRQIYNNLN